MKKHTILLILSILSASPISNLMTTSVLTHQHAHQEEHHTHEERHHLRPADKRETKKDEPL